MHGVNAREHPVFIELTRVKQYFNKIKAAENPEPSQPGLTLDKGAANRFIKAGLSGNDKYDIERTAREKAKINIKFNEPDVVAKKKVVRREAESSDSSDSSDEEEEEKPKIVTKTATQKAKQRKTEMMASRSFSQSKEGTPTSQGNSQNAQRKKKKAEKRKAALKAKKK